MGQLLELSSEEARRHLLKNDSYFNGDLPKYLSFGPVLAAVDVALEGANYRGVKSRLPHDLPDVNYSFIANKDGRLAWRPYELMNPVIYVSLVNSICETESWTLIQTRMREFECGVVESCSAPVVASEGASDTAAQITSWWQRIEQRSLAYSLEYGHLLHTDVVDCYGSLYTHSIPWALHGLEESKKLANRRDKRIIGNVIDDHVQASRYGQTNGIAQGSVLMDLIAELVLGFVDGQINQALPGLDDARILRYRDDYRIFANSEARAEAVLKVVSDKLRQVGMRLGVAKTVSAKNVVEGSVKPDKRAGIDLQDLGTANAKTIQKQLLRLHGFGQRYPNSGALRRLVGDFHTNISMAKEQPDDLEVQVAIVTDIGFTSPSTFPVVAAILSHLIAAGAEADKARLWEKVRSKMRQIPYNGYLEIWLQRVTKPKNLGITFESEEPICRLVNGENVPLWASTWVAGKKLKGALDARKIVIDDSEEVAEVVQPSEVQVFKRNASAY